GRSPRCLRRHPDWVGCRRSTTRGTNMKSSRCSHCEGAAALARRDFLRVGALNFLGITLADFLRFGSTPAFAEATAVAPRAKAQSVILIWLEGGASQVDTWDVKGNSTFHNISTNIPGI